MRNTLLAGLIAFIAIVITSLLFEFTSGERFILLMLIHWKAYDYLEQDTLVKAIKKAFEIEQSKD